MNQLEQIRKISEENNRVITTADVISREISKTALAKFVEKYKIFLKSIQLHSMTKCRKTDIM